MRTLCWRRRALCLLGTVLLAMAGGRRLRADDLPILRVETGGHTAQIRQAVFTADGQRLISIGIDKVIRFWNVPAGRQESTLRYQIGPGREGQLFAVALSRGGNPPLLAIGEGGENADILLFDATTRRRPPQSGQRNTSTAKTRWSSSAHGIRCRR